VKKTRAYSADPPPVNVRYKAFAFWLLAMKVLAIHSNAIRNNTETTGKNETAIHISKTIVFIEDKNRFLACPRKVNHGMI